MNKKLTPSRKIKIILDSLAIHDPRVSYVIEYVAEHPRESLTLKQLSEKIGCCPEHLSRLLKDKALVRFGDLKRTIRMAEAEILLEEGWPIKMVARLCGWKSVEGFSRCFKCRCGVTPGVYQKNAYIKNNVNSNMPWKIVKK